MCVYTYKYVYMYIHCTCIIHVCTCTCNLSLAEPPEDDVILCRAFQFCRVRSKSIEINYQNMDGEKILTKVNFQLDPEV